MNNGICLLCAAVIDKARQDYVTGPDCNLAALEKFVRSDLFQLYSMGLNPDPDTVLHVWNEKRREYRAKLIRNGKRVVNT